MKERWYYVVMIIVLLFVQAYCDLSLPDYTSKIVNARSCVGYTDFYFIICCTAGYDNIPIVGCIFKGIG